MRYKQQDNSFAVIFRFYFKVIFKVIVTVNLFWFDNDFEIESKYHRKIVVLLLIAHILSSQDVVFRSMFFSYILLNRLLVK